MKRPDFIALLILVILSAILLIDPFFHAGRFTAHDIDMNTAYFSGFFSSLQDGNIIPRWSANIANLYGSPTSIFLYPGPYYLASLITIIGFSLVDTMKIYFFITSILSVIFMYLFLRKHFNTLASFVGSFLYLYAPYRINDIYARGNIAENTSFMLFPLLALCLYKFMKNPKLKNIIFISFVTALFLLSHPFLFLVFLPFLISYVFYLHLDLHKLKLLFLSGLLSFGLISFYFFPLIFESKYTLYDISPFSGQYYRSQFINLTQLIIPQWHFIDQTGKLEYQTYQIGIVQLVLAIISIFIFIYQKLNKSLKSDLSKLFLLALFNFLLSTFLMLSISDFVYKLIPPLQRIQFPWRFLALNLFSISLMTAVIFSSLKKQIISYLFALLIVIISILLYAPYAKGHDYKIISDDAYFYDVRINIDAFVTLPRWAAQPDKYPRIGNRYQIIEGKADVELLSRNNISHIYNILSSTPVRFLDATYYFPGWNAYIDGKKANIEFQDQSYRGLITFDIPKGNHFIVVKFESTKLRLFGDMITLGTIIFMIIFYKRYSKT